MIGSELFDKDIENALVGQSVNEAYDFNASNTVKELYNISDLKTISIEPQSIIQYTEDSSNKKFLDENGFSTLSEFYKYLFEVKVAEQDFEQNLSIKDDFIKYAIDKCTFTISSDDLMNYSKQVFNEHLQSAESLGINIDEYYTNILSLDEKEFFTLCADSAEQEIKKCLMIGALSQQYNIDVSDDYLTTFCENNDIDMSDSVSVIYARYLCLESIVLSEFVQLI